MTRIALTAGVLAVWLLGVFGMWRGWRRRVALTALPALPPVPEFAGADLIDPLVGVYLGTTYAGAWLERVAGARLGERSTGWIRILPAGVQLRRPGYDDLFIPIAALQSARTDTAHAGRVIGHDGLLVIEWRHGGTRLDTGFRADVRSRHADVVTAIRALLPAHPETQQMSTDHLKEIS